MKIRYMTIHERGRYFFLKTITTKSPNWMKVSFWSHEKNKKAACVAQQLYAEMRGWA